MTKTSIIVALLVSAWPSHAAVQQNSLNPLRKVVTLLQTMQSKVQEEGARELELYKKFMCYCKNGGGDLSGSIGAAEEKIPAVSSDIEESEAKLSGAKADLKQAQSDRSAAKSAKAEATALREKEAATFASFKAEYDTNIAAIAKATEAISTGVAGSFLQTPAAQVLKRAVSKGEMPEADQEAVTAFLTQSTEYAPQSGEIIGILKEMGDTMAASLSDETATEKGSIKTYGGLMQAKTKEMAALTSTIEAKTKQIGELGVSIVMMKEDLADTQEALGDDETFLAELEKSCATKTSEWEERSKTRAEELVALADTIKVLNDDDALEIFKKTLPGASASLLQVGAGQRSSAAFAIRSALAKSTAQDRPGLELLLLALTGKKTAGAAGFEKVIKMIDNMVSILGKEQADDNDKKEYCSMQFDNSDDQKKALERTIAGEEAAIATAKESMSTLTSEIAALTAGIKALDKSVAEATEQRKEENAEYKALIASDTAATQVLEFAKNRLNKFYNPKLYKPPANTELSSEDRIYVNMGNADDLVTTAAPGGIANTGVTVLAQVSAHKQVKAAPSPPPSTWGAYASKSQENTGVISMIDLLIKDLAKEMTEAETDENDSQADYEQMMKDSAAKRTTDSKALTSKSSAKADTEAELQAHNEHHADSSKELMATMKYISSLHSECDWLLQYFDVRNEARAGEVESLKQAKAVLSGADYTLLQRQSHTFLGRLA